jgi:hypothetical protein
MIKKLFDKNKFAIITSVLVLFLRIPSLFEPYWYGDEGIYLVLGQGIRKGLTLYSQIHDNKPPTLYYLAAISNTVFGFRLLLLASMIGAIYYFNLLSKKFLSKSLSEYATYFFIIITSIPLFEGNIANAEVFMLLPTLAGIYFFLFSKSKQKYLISGLLLGLAFTIKIPVAVEFGFLFLWHLFLTKDKLRSKIINLIIFSISFAAPFLAYLLYFVYKGVFSDFMFSAILQNFGYLSSWQTGSHSGGATNGGLVSRVIILFLFWVFSYVLVVKKYINHNFALITFWFSATVFGSLLSTRPYPHYLIQVLPSLTLLLLSLFDKDTLPKIRLYSIGFILCLLFFFFKFKFYVYPVFSYYNNFYSHIFSLKSANYRNYFGSQVDNTYQISEFVTNNSKPEEKIFIWGDEPYIYALSNRLPVGRFTVAYHISDFNQYQNVYDDLKAYLPNLIVYFPQENRPFTDLDNLIDNYYYPVASFNKAIIFQFRK